MKKYCLLFAFLLIEACDFANLEPIHPQRICTDVEYSLASRAFQCGLDAKRSNRLFKILESRYPCPEQLLKNELSSLTLKEVYACSDSLRRIPCDSVLMWKDSLELWLQPFPICHIFTEATSEQPVRIDSMTCPSGGRSLSLPHSAGARIDSARNFANHGSSWSIGFWIKGSSLPPHQGIFGAELDLNGRMSALLNDQRSAVQRIRIATGSYEGCAHDFPDYRLSLEIGTHANAVGPAYEANLYYTDSVILDGSWQYWLFVKSNSQVSLYVNGQRQSLQTRYCSETNTYAVAADLFQPWNTPFYLGAISDHGNMVRPSGLSFDDLSLWNTAIDHNRWRENTLIDSARVIFLSLDSLNPLVQLPQGARLEADCAF